jgi:NADH:ubiquinone oxidoreductase subunit 6 (subunit J)
MNANMDFSALAFYLFAGITVLASIGVIGHQSSVITEHKESAFHD